jgi:hypothetical protein
MRCGGRTYGNSGKSELVGLSGDNQIGPDELPVVDHPDDPHLAVFTAIVHAHGRGAARAARAALGTLDKVDVATAREYTTLILACATLAVRRALEATLLDLKLPPAPILAVLEERQRAAAREEGLEEGAQLGRRAGYVHVLRTQLRRRFGSVPEWAEGRLAAAALPELERWVDAVVDAASLEAVLGAAPG